MGRKRKETSWRLPGDRHKPVRTPKQIKSFNDTMKNIARKKQRKIDELKIKEEDKKEVT
jgi:hypothetical protein